MKIHDQDFGLNFSSKNLPLQVKPCHVEMPLLLQVSDVQTSGACIWIWHGCSTEIILRWEIDGKPQTPLIFPLTHAESGWTSTIALTQLPTDCVITLAACITETGQCATAYFSTPPSLASDRSITLGWGGDVCGQSYGRHVSDGLPIFDVLTKQSFDLFILCGDLIYADHDIPKNRCLPNGGLWVNNLDNPYAKAVGLPVAVSNAVSTDDFRSKYLYLWADDGFQRFVCSTPMVYVLDDHEIYNNWTTHTRLVNDTRYPIHLDFKALCQSGLKAWYEFAPRTDTSLKTIAPGFNKIHYGELLDIFVLDVRSQRAANSHNKQTEYNDSAYWLGPCQLNYLIDTLLNSTAVWKILVSGNPLSVMVNDADAQHTDGDEPIWDGVANGDHGQPLGREIELAFLLKKLKNAGLKNLVVLSGDVHFSSAIHYDPEQAAFKEFLPFWEFISGPLHAGGFPAKDIDRTFGAKQVFVASSIHPASPPGPGSTMFGKIEIDASTCMMTASLCDHEGQSMFTKTLIPDSQK